MATKTNSDGSTTDDHGLLWYGGKPQVTFFRDFIHLLEEDLAVPATPANDAFFTAWQLAEGNPGIKQFNPYNIAATTAGQGGGGTARFKNWIDGASWTANYIKRNANPGGMYAAFYQDLKRGDSAYQTATDVGNSRWAAGHYGGAGASIKRALANNPDAGFIPPNTGSKPGLSDIPGAAAGVASSAVGGITGLLTDPLRQTIVFVTLLGGALGLILLGAKRAADPIMPRVSPATLAAVAA